MSSHAAAPADAGADTRLPQVLRFTVPTQYSDGKPAADTVAFGRLRLRTRHFERQLAECNSLVEQRSRTSRQGNQEQQCKVTQQGWHSGFPFALGVLSRPGEADAETGVGECVKSAKLIYQKY